MCVAVWLQAVLCAWRSAVATVRDERAQGGPAAGADAPPDRQQWLAWRARERRDYQVRRRVAEGIGRLKFASLAFSKSQARVNRRRKLARLLCKHIAERRCRQLAAARCRRAGRRVLGLVLMSRARRAGQRRDSRGATAVATVWSEWAASRARPARLPAPPTRPRLLAAARLGPALANLLYGYEAFGYG